MAMAKVLVHVPLIRLGKIILAIIFCGICGEDRRTLVQVQRDVALQTNREAQISAGRKVHAGATGRSSSFDRSVDGWRVDRLAVTFGAEDPHVVDACDAGS